MSKPVIMIAAAALAGLASCVVEPPPPPHFRPNPPYAPDPYGNEPTPPVEPTPQPPANDPVPSNGEYPVARKTDDPNQVLSPYAPYNVIDVDGFRPGQLARDPSNQKIFRVP